MPLYKIDLLLLVSRMMMPSIASELRCQGKMHYLIGGMDAILRWPDITDLLKMKKRHMIDKVDLQPMKRYHQECRAVKAYYGITSA